MSLEHNVKEYSILQITMNLTAACIISGAIIAGTYFVTNPVAQKNNVMLKNKAMQALVKDAKDFTPVYGKTDWFEAKKNGKTIAYVISEETKGYGGKIKMLVAITPNGKVMDYDILGHNETPGLGDNASKEPFKSQFEGKDIKHLVVVKDPSDKEDIQAMTGATISSKAVTNGVKEAVEQVMAHTGGK